MIIDAKDLIMGRLASFAAKQALRGETVDVINAEKVVITGSRKNVLERYIQKRDRGHPYSGPFFQRREEKLLKKTITGMLPHKQEKGRKATKNIKCYTGIPPQFQGKPVADTTKINVHNTRNFKYITLQELCSLLGRKQ
jgi:large subunit ribosomal protein L13